MDPVSTKPRVRRIAAVLVAQIEALEPADARRIEIEHRATRMDDNPAWQLAVMLLARAGRSEEWTQVQAAVWDAIDRCGLPQRVRYAAYDAAYALLTRDLIDPVSFRQLFGPWASGRDEHVMMLD